VRDGKLFRCSIPFRNDCLHVASHCQWLCVCVCVCVCVCGVFFFSLSVPLSFLRVRATMNFIRKREHHRRFHLVQRSHIERARNLIAGLVFFSRVVNRDQHTVHCQQGYQQSSILRSQSSCYGGRQSGGRGLVRRYDFVGDGCVGRSFPVHILRTESTCVHADQLGNGCDGGSR
jgi:hypothetical protein